MVAGKEKIMAQSELARGKEGPATLVLRIGGR
jgi:hypothetical protein